MEQTKEDDLVIPFDVVSLPSVTRLQIESSIEKVRALRAKNARLKETVRQNERRIDQTLASGKNDGNSKESEASSCGGRVGPSSLRQEMQDMETFLKACASADMPEVRMFQHLAEAGNFRLVRLAGHKDSQRMLDLLQLEQGNSSAFHGTTLTQKFERLKQLVSNGANDQNSFEVKHVLHMIDAQDVEGLKQVLNSSILRRCGLLDDTHDTESEGAGFDRKSYVGSLPHDGVMVPLSLEQLLRLSDTGVGEVLQAISRDEADGRNLEQLLLGKVHEPETDTLDDPTLLSREIQTGRGNIRMIKMRESSPVTGLQILPQLNSLCVAHFRNGLVSHYSEEGEVLTTFSISKMSNPSGMAALQTVQNAVIISDHDEKNLHVLMFSNTEGTIVLKEHRIWKLLFKPGDVTTFKENKLAILGMGTGTIHVMTEDGNYIDKIFLHISPGESSLYSAFISKTQINAVDCKSPNGAVLWADKKGKIIRSYGGNKKDHESLHEPMHAIEDSQGRFIVADHNNHRLHLVSKDGRFLQFLLQRSDGLEKPRRLYMDTSKEKLRLFVSFGYTGKIRVGVYDYEDLCKAKTMFFDDEVEDER